MLCVAGLAMRLESYIAVPAPASKMLSQHQLKPDKCVEGHIIMITAQSPSYLVIGLFENMRGPSAKKKSIRASLLLI